MNKVRILSLDGGGSRAGVLAKALGELYDARMPGRELLRQFDFVAGNSGGSIVMTALACNFTPQDIAGFYDDPATLRRMFSPRWVARIPLLRNVLPRYSSSGKLAALTGMFDAGRQQREPLPSTIPLHEWPRYLGERTNLLVTAFDYDRKRAAFFRTNAHSRAKSSAPARSATLVEAVHASTNAPVRFFDKPAEVGGGRYWDGGLAGFDNPVLAAVTEALANRPADIDHIRVLSVGTGTSALPMTTEGAPPPLGRRPDGTSLWTALRKAGTAIFDDPPAAATFHAHVALRQPLPPAGESFAEGNLVRVCPMLAPRYENGHWEMPAGLGDDEFEALVTMELDAMTQADVDLVRTMVRRWFEGSIANQPIRMGERLRCDIGQSTFAAAKAHWQRIA